MTFESVKCALSCPGGSTAAASKEKYFEGSLARWGGRGGGGGICHHPLNLGLGVDSRQSQGRGCMMTVVVTISSSSVASITPRSALLDTIILRTELMVKTEVSPPSSPPLAHSVWPEFTWKCWEVECCRWLGGRGEEGFKFKQKIKHRQDHPGREVGSNISQMPSS